MQRELGASKTESYSVLKAPTSTGWGLNVCLAVASEWLAIHPHHHRRANSMEDEVDTSTLQIFHGNVERCPIKTSGWKKHLLPHSDGMLCPHTRTSTLIRPVPACRIVVRHIGCHQSGHRGEGEGDVRVDGS